MLIKWSIAILASLTILWLPQLVLASSPVQDDGEEESEAVQGLTEEAFVGSACVQDTVHARDMAGRYEISVEEACRRLDFQVEKIPLMRALRRDHADVFGGAYVDHHGGGVLYVAVTESSAAVRALTADLAPAGGRIDTVLVEHSEKHLDQVAAALRDELGPWRDGVGAEWDGRGIVVATVAVDPERNRVVASVPAPDLAVAEQALTSRYGSVVVVEQAGLIPSDVICTRADCDPPLRGGLRLEERGEHDGCTLGFMAHNHASSQSHYAITAGHCAAIGEVWQHRDEDIGGVPGGGSLEAGRTDAARIHVGATSNFSPGNGYYIYRDPNAQLYQVHYRATFGDFVKNDEICKSGITTLYSCGPIITINGSCCSNNVQMQVDTCGDRGDSGGPMYVPNGGAAFAVAVLQGGTPDNGCHWSDNIWGSHVEYVQADLGIHMNIKTDN